jgi:hypothetical protein
VVEGGKDESGEKKKRKKKIRGIEKEKVTGRHPEWGLINE